MKNILLMLLCLTFLINGINAQEFTDNKEDDISVLKLPDPLRLLNGIKIRKSRKWEKWRRPELLKLFENNIYGRIPGKPDSTTFMVLEQSDDALNNKAIRKQVLMTFKKGDLELPVLILIYLPKTIGKVPVFLGYNFNGNHTIIYDSEIMLTESWVKDNPSFGIINNQITEQSRGVMSERWPIEKIIDRGYGLVTVYYGDIDPDKDDFSDGIHPFFYEELQNRPRSGEWGSIAAWAWGLTKVMDYLQEDIDVDANNVIVMGHSRLGKTALWAGAIDERFAMVISNNSGCGGAALSIRKQGETIKDINRAFPHWFSSNFKYYNFNEELLPVDQHELIALMAPRPVYIASAEEDNWADPRGEFLSAFFASKVYGLYDMKGIENQQMPAVNCPVMNQVGYHIRPGKHGVKDYDWDQFLNFADFHLKREGLPVK